MKKQTTKKIEKIIRRKLWRYYPDHLDELLDKILDKQDEIIEHINKEEKHD